VQIEPFNLGPGEARMVGRAIARALQAAARQAEAAQQPPATDISGEWEFTVHFLKGARQHRVKLQQRGAEVSGQQDSPGFSGAVKGRVAAASVQLVFDGAYEGSTVYYSFEGGSVPAGLAGTVLFGAADAAHAGVLNLRQHGAGTWEARRLG
jgi:hypothetical protein